MPEARQPRVLVMSLIFPPDGVSTAQLLGEIVEDLATMCESVQVVTTTPHYNVDESAQASQPISWKWHRLVGTSDFRGATVSHIRMPKKAAGKLARIAQWGWFHLASFVIALGKKGSFDVIFTVSPPPTVATVAGAVRRVTKTPVIYAVWELYPEILVKLGQLRAGSQLHKVLRRLERRTYLSSDRILVLQDAMRDAIVSTDPDVADKTFVVPTFADTDFLHPLPRATSLRDEYGLADSFVVGYAGNLGVSQDLSVVIEAASLLKDDPVSFLICGDGTERAHLEQLQAKFGATNVVFTGHLPYERVPEIIATSDVNLVVLATGVGSEALPSKAYRIMACGRPILAVSDAGSPLERLVNDHGTGVAVQPSDASELAQAILGLVNNPDRTSSMGTAARQVAETKFSRTAVTKQYANVIESVIDQQPELS